LTSIANTADPVASICVRVDLTDTHPGQAVLGGDDVDGDGVVNELTHGDMSALAGGALARRFGDLATQVAAAQISHSAAACGNMVAAGPTRGHERLDAPPARVVGRCDGLARHPVDRGHRHLPAG
jgi:hypothetical protein